MRIRFTILLCVVAAAIVPGVLAQTRGPKVTRRAQPPKFEKADHVFFADAFKDALMGERPTNLGQPLTAVAASSTGSAATPAGGAPPVVSGAAWSALISPASIEDEVKALKLHVDQEVTTPSDFAGKGYKIARRDFSMLAMLFGVIGEYDGDVRWKKDAPAARDVFARTAANAKVGTPQVYQEAKLRKAELQDLIGGASPFGGKTAEPKAQWGQVCDRAPLMQHLEAVWEPRLKPLLASKDEFNGSPEKVLHDAEVIAVIGAVLAKEGMADADAEEYKAFCNRLRDAAKEIADAVKAKNYDQANKASIEIGKSCVECHENYRA